MPPHKTEIRRRIVSMLDGDESNAYTALSKETVARATLVLNDEDVNGTTLAIRLNMGDAVYLRRGLADHCGFEYQPGTGVRPFRKDELIAIHDALAEALGGEDPIGTTDGAGEKQSA